MSDEVGRKRGKRIVVFEGAGVKGLSSLKVLSEIMNRVQYEEGLDEPPDPNEWFEFVVGTDTAAFIVALIGRLRMPIGKTVEAFKKLGEDVFSEKKAVSRSAGSTEYKTTRLKQTLKDIVRQATGKEDEMMLEQSDPKCKTMIFAMSKHNMNAGIPTVFRSYCVSANQTPDCTIWEAICASTAYPGQFKSIDIGEPPMRESFVAGALGCSNPTIHALEEVKRLCPNEHISSIICIGAGHPRTIQISEPSPFQRIIAPLDPIVIATSIVRDSERVAHDMAVRFRGTTDVYFRLSVEQGMQDIETDDWNKLNKVVAHTQAYMRQTEVNATINNAVKSIRERREEIPTTHIDGEIQVLSALQTSNVKECPEPTPSFTGRADKIDQIQNCLLRGDQERCVIVLHGLGGAGKTQTALKVVERTREIWTDIIFIDATSRETASSALESFAVAKRIGKTNKDAIRWLGGHKERWLMVFDNADDPSLGIRSFFPSGNHGSIMITTRLHSLVLLARGKNSECKISDMAAKEAMDLLVKTARLEKELVMGTEHDSAVQLLREFGYLALAIVHAGAYIWCTQCTISHYRAMFLKQRQNTLDKYHKIFLEVDNYQKGVYATWCMSYQLLSTGAQQTLWLMAFLHHDNITEEIFQRAAINQQKYEPVIPASADEIKIQDYMKNYLKSFLDSTGAWDSSAFLDVMTELMSYSLINHDRVNASYTLHVLVHDWAGTMVPDPVAIGVEYTAFLLVVAINYTRNSEDMIFKRKLEVHVSKLLERLIQPRANYGAFFAEVYGCTGRWNPKQRLEVSVMNARKAALGHEHSGTLTSMHNLASTYQCLGQYERAEALHVQVLEISKRVLGDEHPGTLTSMQNLALTYQRLGQYERAKALQVQVLKIHKRVLGHEHPSTLASMHNLASTYQDLGQYERAEALNVQELEISKRVLGNEHPDTLASMHNLALTYQRLGQYVRAEALQVEVLEISKRVLGDEHPSALISMSNLASTYQYLGQYERSAALHVQVLEIRKQVLGDEHPDTLLSMHNLASTYHNLGRYERAEALHLQVIEIRKRVLGDEHPSTLASIHNLASTYRDLGQYERAKALQVQVLDFRRRVLGDEHPTTLSSMYNLALTYQRLGQYVRAEALHVQVMEIRKRVLGDNHPDTLTSVHNLASTYRDLGQYERAEALHVQVLEIQKRVLGDEHPDMLTSMQNLASTYQYLGQYERAEELHVQVMEIRKQVLGDEHPSTLASIHNLASTYEDLGQYERAKAMHVQVLEIRKQMLGDEHPDTLASMHNLALTYHYLGRYEQAAALHVQVMKIRKRVLGDEHPDTLTSMHNLASTYRYLGQYEQAEVLQVQALEALKKVLGSRHPNTLKSMKLLARIYRHSGESRERQYEMLQKEISELKP